MNAHLPGADAGVSDLELTEPVGELTAGRVDWLICFVVDSPDGATISTPPLDSCIISTFSKFMTGTRKR